MHRISVTANKKRLSSVIAVQLEQFCTLPLFPYAPGDIWQYAETVFVAQVRAVDGTTSI